MRRKLFLGVSTAALAIGGANEALTQFVAARLSYHPALGRPLAGHYYAPWKWVEWMRAPWAADAPATFALAKAAVMGALMLSMLGAMVFLGNRSRKPIKHPDLHGTARFQTPEEIKRSGLLGGAGVYVGGWTDAKGNLRYLRHDGPEHCSVVAPTRTGKDVGNIIPTLLSWPDSAVIQDEKGELWEVSAGWRSRVAGNICIKFEPGSLSGSAAKNLLDEIRLGTPYEVSDAQIIAQMIVDPHGVGIEGQDHWGKASFDLLAAVFLHVLYRARSEGRTAGFADVAFALSDPDKDSPELWEEMRVNRWDNGRAHRVVASGGVDQLSRDPRERNSVLSSAKTYLTIFKDPIVARNTSHSDFMIADIMDHEKPLSLYVRTLGADKDRLRPLVRLLLTMTFRHHMGAELKYKNGRPQMPHKHRLLMTFSEFASLGQLDIAEEALKKCAVYGIKCFLAIQDRNDLFKAYKQHQTIMSNCHVRIVYAPNETETAKWISETIGNTTRIVEQITESGPRLGALNHVSRTYQATQRPLMTPDEIMALRRPVKDAQDRILESGEMVIFQAGERPILGSQTPYWNDPVFAARACVPPPASGRTVSDGGIVARFAI